MSFTKADLLIYPKEKTAGHIRTYYPQYIYIYIYNIVVDTSYS